MKIAVMINGHIPLQYAHSVNTIKHAAAFYKLGYEVEFLCIERCKESIAKKTIVDICKYYGVEQVTIKFFKDKSIFYFQEFGFIGKVVKGLDKITFGFFKKFNDVEKEISNYIKNNNFNLCFARSYRIVKYNIENKIATILETHNPIPNKNKEVIELIKFGKSEYFKGIVTIHDKLKQNFVDVGMPKDKVIVYEDAVDLDLFDNISDNKNKNREELNLPMNKKIVLYSGSLKKGKGIHIILDIAKGFELNYEILFYIVGGSDKEIENWKKYKNTDKKNVVFAGFVEGGEVPKYLKASDILIMPYDVTDKKMVMDINTTSPIKLFEYMASKRPIVSTNLDVITKILKDKESILLSNSYSEYSNIIEDLLYDEELAKKISINAYKKVEKFTYKNRCKFILNELLKKEL